jgi:hypothetical protein
MSGNSLSYELKLVNTEMKEFVTLEAVLRMKMRDAVKRYTEAYATIYNPSQLAIELFEKNPKSLTNAKSRLTKATRQVEKIGAELKIVALKASNRKMRFSILTEEWTIRNASIPTENLSPTNRESRAIVLGTA